MDINKDYVNKIGVKYHGVIEKAFKKEELCNIGKFVHQTDREQNVFGKENGVYIYQDKENKDIAYRIYDEFADYGFNGYCDDKLIFELNKRKNGIELTDFPKGLVTCEGNIIGQIIPYYPNSETIFSYAKRTKNVNVVKYYKKIIDIINELYINGIIYCDAHAKNFLLVNNNIKLIDFDLSLIDFENRGYMYKSMINTLINMLNTLNSVIGVDYFVDIKFVRDLQDLEKSVNEMEKKLVK